MWDLSSPTRDQIHVHCIGRWILNHWTTREVLMPHLFHNWKFLPLILLHLFLSGNPFPLGPSNSHPNCSLGQTKSNRRFFWSEKGFINWFWSPFLPLEGQATGLKISQPKLSLVIKPLHVTVSSGHKHVIAWVLLPQSDVSFSSLYQQPNLSLPYHSMV